MSTRLAAIHACVLAGTFSLLLPAGLAAQELDAGVELKQLQQLLAVYNTEIKSDLDQVLVLQEALKANARPTLMAQGRTPTPASFEAVAETQRLAIQRESALNDRLSVLLARSAALDARKLPVLERMRDISMAPGR
jgi:hypothetical protein